MKNIASNFSKSSIYLIYLLGFLFAFRDAVPTYVNSTFLTSFSSENYVGLIYSFASIISIICFLIIPSILKKYGNRNTALFIASIDLFALSGLISIKDPTLLIMFFIISNIAVVLLAFINDVFLESYSSDNSTGQTRGFYLTSVNFAWMLSPLISAFFLKNNNYWIIFAIASLPIFPYLFIISRRLKGFVDPNYPEPSLLVTISEIWKKVNLRRIFVVNFLIQFFYAWMVIYSPIYLHDHLGLDWTSIGIIFFVMLIPFVILDYPLGKLADRKMGEKELLITGLIIMIISTISISFFQDSSIILWAIILFATRLGAATVEVMSETYFFKQIDGTGANIISSFRTMRPLSYITAPVIASVFLYLFDIKYIFLTLGLILVIGLKQAFALKDTQ
jgi:MFS family permease